MSHVYVISEGERGPVKIGVAGNPYARLGGLQSGNARKLRVAHCWKLSSRNEAFRVERYALDKLAKYRLVGEWIDADEFGVCALIDYEVAGR